MNVLSIDTATEVCGFGLLLSNDNWLDSSHKTGLNHAGNVLEGVHRILEDGGVAVSDLDLIVCSRGPGSFTGLRIGMATAKGLAAGAHIPLVSVFSLDAMAYGLEWAARAVLPIIDAKKRRVYTAVYKNGEKQQGPIDLPLSRIDDLVKELGRVLLTGPGARLAAAHCTPSEAIAVDMRDHAWNQAYIRLGIEQFKRTGADPPDAGPTYLRKSDAELMSGNSHV